MNIKILSIAFISCILVFSGCKDDEGTTTPSSTKSKTELISASPWILKGLTVSPGFDDGEGNIITNLYDEDESCDNDDETIYNANGTGSYNEGATKCEPDDEQELGTFIWSFNSSETQLIEDGETFNIVELSANKFVQQISNVEDNITYTVTATFTH